MSIRFSICGVTCEVIGPPEFIQAVAAEHRPYLTESHDGTSTVTLTGYLSATAQQLPEGAILESRAGDFDRYVLGDQTWLVNGSVVWRCRGDGDSLWSIGYASEPQSLLQTARVLLEVGVAAAMEAKGHLALHGSAIKLGDKGVLLLGESGFGKSTLAAWLSRHNGAALMADDTCFYSPQDDRLVGYLPHVAVYTSSETAGAYAYSAGVYRLLVNPVEAGTTVAAEAPHGATVIIQPVWGNECRLDQVGATAALYALAPLVADGIKPFFRATRDAAELVSHRLASLHRLLHAHPVYILRAGRRPQEVAQHIARHLGSQTPVESQVSSTI